MRTTTSVMSSACATAPRKRSTSARIASRIAAALAPAGCARTSSSTRSVPYDSPAARLLDEIVQPAEDAGRLAELIAQQREPAAQRREDQAAGEAVAGDVAADDGDALGVEDEEVVVIAADLGGRQRRRREVDPV